ncbi:hypothetical protein [Bradyrhizobium brasilense]|uniref:Uncharacterized protein n=1 Tax=Bradyrhizobium brasilense TaxID=1419277 RepID=A0ABY8JMU3_9BRAD|nr:hypothetical protein [Bradyrhizobium brasilense]WFU65816.1 hypothetical protein QA636_10000 [Bradyrhizobium brasilense]
MYRFALLVALFSSGIGPAHAEDKAPPSPIDSITKSARDLMPSMPAVSLPSLPNLSLPDFSDATGKLTGEFNVFTQQLGEALPVLEQMGYEVTTFRVTWGLPPKARLRLKSSGNSDVQKVNSITTKASGSGLLVTTLISSAAMAKRIQNTMKMGTAYLDVDFAVPPKISMKFIGAGASEKSEVPRELDDLEIACK